MTQPTLIFLTETAFHAALITAAKDNPGNGACRIEAADTLDAVKDILVQATGPARLVGFCTGVIVSSALLQKFKSGAYNFHPGPPEYPGIFPSCFAIYERAESFGATAHRMTENIDEGEIVGVERVSLMPWSDRLAVDTMAFECVMRLFKRLLPGLMDFTTPLPASGDAWLGRPRTKKDFKNLCMLPEDVSEDEFELRYRAVGEGPEHALSINLFGNRFRLDNARSDEPVVRGGQNAD